MRQAIWLVALVISSAIWAQGMAFAQGLQALARVDVEQSKIEDKRNGSISLQLQLSQPVPFWVFTLNNPARVVMDFREVDWTGFNKALVDQSERVSDVRFGIFRPGWSRLLLDLNTPVVPDQTEMRVDDTRRTATLRIDMIAASQ